MSAPKKPAGKSLAENLSQDFSSRQERTQHGIGALYRALLERGHSPRLRSCFEQWGQRFSVATEYGRQSGKWQEKAALQKAFYDYGLAEADRDFGRLIFATHTFFAILAKLLAYRALTERANSSPAATLPALKEWLPLSEAALADRFLGVENGSSFQAAGLGGFSGDDFFGWYASDPTPELLRCLRAVVSCLVGYEMLPSRTDLGQSRDMLKKVYLELVPSAVRKALGEYYTPDWLAQRLLDLLEKGRFTGDPEKRLLDPACGSGTFLVLAINAIVSHPRSRSLRPAELLRKICQNVVGIDLNPLAVIAARANYLMALGPLLGHRGPEPLAIPVHLGDSIRLPSLQEPKAAVAPIPSSHLSGFDYVAGNPPWIGWEDLPEAYRNETKELWSQHGLLVHRGMDTILGKGRKDLSMLMTCVAAEHYLKPAGKLGFIITQAVFKMAGAAQGFRRFSTRSQIPLRCERVEDYSALPLFGGAATRTALVVIQKGEKQHYPTPYFVFRPSRLSSVGEKRSPAASVISTDGVGPLEAEEWQAQPSDRRDPTSSWLTGTPKLLRAIRNVLGPSDYQARQGVNTGGANAVYWFEILAEDGPGGVVARNIIGAAKRKIPSQSVPLEKARLFPLLIGGDVAAWQTKPSAWLLFVQDPQTRRGVSESQMATTPKTLQWLEQNKKLLLSRAAYKRFFKPETDPFWSMFDAGPYTLAPWKVVWPRIARRLEAAVVSSENGKRVLAQETFSFVGVEEETEAYYIAGVVNATPFRFAVSAFSQPGSKSFGTPGILQRARIPRFDPASALHRAIAAEAKRLSGAGPGRPTGANAQLDGLCRNLWGLSPEELLAIQRAECGLTTLAPPAAVTAA